MKTKGFTLIELLVVLALIAILASVLIVIIKPAEIFKRGRDAQRQGDLRNLSAAIDAYIAERAQNSSLGWNANCTTLYFSTSTNSVLPGWPSTSSASNLNTVTGSISQAVNGNGWVPLNFSAVSYLNLANLPLDPRNGQSGTVNGITTVFAYSFACNNNDNESYELAAKLEGPTSTIMANDGGNRNCNTATSTDCLYEVGPGKASVY
jgi:prepilin-type N-terminal cleavage/methylation domain-containing protein